MQRTVTMPADLAGRALDDLKGWLGISRPNEDDLLTDLLAASLAMCEAFTGQTPIEQEIEQSVPAVAGVHNLSARPVRQIISAHGIGVDGTRTPLDASAYEGRINAVGNGCIHLVQAPVGQAVSVTLIAGIAADWASLPSPLKQGIIRLAAFHYRDRETGRDATPPVSVTALWRPWRVVRLT